MLPPFLFWWKFPNTRILGGDGALGLVNQNVALVDCLMTAVRARRPQSFYWKIRLVVEKELLQRVVVNCGMTERQQAILTSQHP
jgi:hypothetical protein